MKKITYAIVLSLFTFAILNFFYSNVGGEAFNYPLRFQFAVPYLFTLHSVPIPLGFVLIVCFCLGMVFLPLLQLIPAIFRNAQIRSQERRIRELERELEMTRDAEIRPDPESASSS